MFERAIGPFALEMKPFDATAYATAKAAVAAASAVVATALATAAPASTEVAATAVAATYSTAVLAFALEGDTSLTLARQTARCVRTAR